MVVEWFSELARRVLALSGVAVLVGVLLPKGGMRACVRLVLGVMLIAILVEPLVDLFPSDTRVSAAIFENFGGNNYHDNTEEIIAAGSDLGKAAELQAKGKMAEDLARQIDVFVCSQADVADCTVTVEFMDEDSEAASSGFYDVTKAASNNWGRVFIMLSVDERAADVADDVAERVCDRVAAFYDLPMEDVRVSLVKFGSKNLVEGE